MYEFQARKSPYKKDISIIPNDGHFEIEIEKTFHLKNIYKELHQQLVDWEYYDADLDSGDKWENLYYEIKKGNGLMFHHIWWRMLKTPKGSETNDLFRFFLRINFQTIAMSKHETMINGKKFKTYKGDLIIRIKAYVRLDPKDKWKKHPILKHFEKIMVERWMAPEVKRHKKMFYADLVALQRLIKQLIGSKVEVGTSHQWMDEMTGV